MSWLAWFWRAMARTPRNCLQSGEDRSLCKAGLAMAVAARLASRSVVMFEPLQIPKMMRGLTEDYSYTM